MEARRSLEALGFFGFFLALIDPPHKLFDQFGKSFRDRLRKVDMCLDSPPDEFQKLAALRGLLLVVPRFHGRSPIFF
jgi:hypothetical protein